MGRSKKKKLTSLKLNSLNIHNSLTTTINEAYYDKFKFYYFIFGQEREEYGEIDESKEISFPKELEKFRQFLHPFRLTFLQLIYQEDDISSIALRKKLDLSWADFYKAMHSLEKAKLIETYDNFDDKGFLRQHLSITDKGRKDYLEMIKLLDKFVEAAKESIPDIDKKNIFSHFN